MKTAFDDLKGLLDADKVIYAFNDPPEPLKVAETVSEYKADNDKMGGDGGES
jgi:hypothetical protein